MPIWYSDTYDQSFSTVKEGNGNQRVGHRPNFFGLAVSQASERVIHCHFPFSASLPLKAYFQMHMHRHIIARFEKYLFSHSKLDHKKARTHSNPAIFSQVLSLISVLLELIRSYLQRRTTNQKGHKKNLLTSSCQFYKMLHMEIWGGLHDTSYRGTI